MNEYGKNDLIPFYLEIEPRSEVFRNQQCERCRAVFCEEESTVRKRVWQSNALVSPTKTLNRDVAPIGDDIEPIGESRTDVEMGSDEDEEPLEAEKKQEDSGHAVYKSWCGACVEGRGEQLEEEERERTTPNRSSRLRFLDTGKRRHVSNSDLSRQQVWSNGSDML